MPTPANVKWQGASGMTRIGRGRWAFTAQDITCVLRYKGPYDTCLNNMPFVNDTVQGYTAYGVKVDHAELDEGDGATGLVTITLRNPNSNSVTRNGSTASAPQAGQIGDALPLLHWQPFRRKIEVHPLCGKSNLPPGTGASTDGHIPQTNYTAVDGGWDWDDYNSLIKAGITEYDEKQPVLTLTTEWYTKPTTVGTNNFQLDDPPTDQQLPIPGGEWKWLRGGDELTRVEKRWRLVQSWTGFAPGNDRNSAFELLYETGTASLDP